MSLPLLDTVAINEQLLNLTHTLFNLSTVTQADVTFLSYLPSTNIWDCPDIFANSLLLLKYQGHEQPVVGCSRHGAITN